MNAKLPDAVAIFKELGWEGVTGDNILELPVGTPEQKKVALAGLKSGEWGEMQENTKGTWRWENFVDVDTSKVALFAVRVGVDARRASNICRGNDHEMLMALLASRGRKYVTDFINNACVSSRRVWEHSSTAFGEIAVKLVGKLELEIPSNVDYIKDWSACAAVAMGVKKDIDYWQSRERIPGLDIIEKRFVEHVEAGVAVGAPATGPFGKVLPAGVARGWLSRERAVPLVFSALDAAVRPGDRKVWLAVLEELVVTDDEYCQRVQALIPLLALSDNHVITKLAPILIEKTEEDLLVEILLGAFSATTKKAKRLVLKSALTRKTPPDAFELLPWLTIFIADKDKSIANLATKLLEQWEFTLEVDCCEEEVAVGLWQETPPIWEVPAFELGEVSAEVLTELASEMMRRKFEGDVYDVTAERFLAMINALAYLDHELARMSLQGLRDDWGMLRCIMYWVKGEQCEWGGRNYEGARDIAVAMSFGKLPCLLSTPSKVDLSISVADLVSRLKEYKNASIDPLEADFLLALFRLDKSTITVELFKELEKINVAVVAKSGEKMNLKSGEIVLNYLADPIKEPILDMSENGYWQRGKFNLPDSLEEFTSLDSEDGWSNPMPQAPHFGNSVLTNIRWSQDVNHSLGLEMRQAARRRAPLPAGGAVNFLGALRPEVSEDALIAVSEAWERGLLRPKAADISFLDWSTEIKPASIVALCQAFEELACEGMLSLVWPVIDDLIQASLGASRMLPGTADLAELIQLFLPEVQLAIEKGMTGVESFALPGLRKLAQRSGSSRAVVAAKNVVKNIPAVSFEEERPAEVVMNPPFDDVWKVRENKAELIDDGVEVKVSWLNEKKKIFVFTLTLPDALDQIIHIVEDCRYSDLKSKGPFEAYLVDKDEADAMRDQDNRIWLYYDEQQQKLVATKIRNPYEDYDRHLQRERTPFTAAILTIIVGILAQDGDAIYRAPRIMDKHIKVGNIDENIIRIAMKILLRNPVVSPAKLARIIEKDIIFLSTLWPMLTESTRVAGEQIAAGNKPPVWINRILDIALRYAPYLREACKRDLIPEEDGKWHGLADIAASTGKSVAVGKARKLMELLELEK